MRLYKPVREYFVVEYHDHHGVHTTALHDCSTEEAVKLINETISVAKKLAKKKFVMYSVKGKLRKHILHKTLYSKDNLMDVLLSKIKSDE